MIFKLDRLIKDLYIQEHLIKRLEALGVGLISTKEVDLVGNDSMCKVFRQFVGIVSELEKSFITVILSSGRINKTNNKKTYAQGAGIGLGCGTKNKDLIINAYQADTTQRELDAAMGVSLGKVNDCINALIEKGIVKANNFRRNSHKGVYIYLLTPGEVQEKARVTTRFLQRKMTEYDALQAEIADSAAGGRCS